MNIVNKLTLRHMKHNKRRTLVTIIGVVISVAMITAVAMLGVSFLNMMKKEAIATDGLWHVAYANANKQQVTAIRDDESTKQLLLVDQGKHDGLGFAKFDGLKTPKRPYLKVEVHRQRVRGRTAACRLRVGEGPAGRRGGSPRADLEGLRTPDAGRRRPPAHARAGQR